MTEHKLGYLVAFDRNLSPERIEALREAMAALPDVQRIIGPVPGVLETCGSPDCPDCQAAQDCHPTVQ